MKRKLNDIMQSLLTQDVETLKSIYAFRCLTEKQIYQLHFESITVIDEELSKQFVKRRIEELIAYNLIKEVLFLGVERAYFLTPLGIELIRNYFEIPSEIYDKQKRVVKRGYYRASELEMHPKNINHQIHLNQFVIDFEKLKLDVNHKYFDEKYVSQYTSIRPDGMLSVLDTDFFLEMDMATESKKQLFEKWENYRNFLNSREYDYREKRVVVLFIVDGTNKIKERINLIKYTIYERLLDVLNDDFEVYVGTSDMLLSLLKDRLIPAGKNEDPYCQQVKTVLEDRHHFFMTDGESDKIRDLFEGTKFSFYMRKLNNKNKLLVEDGRIQEFLVDDYFHEPTTVVAKIAYMEKYNSLFKSEYNREIPYLIVAKDEDQLYNDLKMVDLIGLKNIFFTTHKRLQSLPFCEAVFQFDLLGNLHHFANNGLEQKVFEGNFEQLRLAN